MLLKSKYPKSCSYCRHSTKVDDDTVLCAKRGIAASTGACHKFSYDPCKRIPSKSKALDFHKYTKDDFSL